MNEITVKAKSVNLKKIREFVRSQLKNSVDHLFQEKIVLAIDEACQNIIRHGYDGNSDDPINIKIDLDKFKLVVDFYDKGHPMNPGKLEPKKKITDVSPGGLGLNFINEISSHYEFVKCELKEFTNHLTMHINLDKKI